MATTKKTPEKAPAKKKPAEPRIHGVRVQNVLAVERVTIRPKANGVTVVAGKNGAGKSSLLRAVEMVLDWRATSRKVANPLKKGTAKGVAELDLGDGLIARRTITEKGTTLTVTQSGVTKPGPQSFLDAIRPQTLLDPLAFSNARPEDRRLMMIEIAGLDEELGKAQAAIAAAEEKRREAGREAKRTRALYEGLPEAPEDAPDERVSVSDLARELEMHREAREQHERAMREAERMSQIAEEAQERVDAYRRSLKEAEHSLATAQKVAEDAQEALMRSKYDEDAELLVRKAIGRAEDTNARVEARERKEAAHIAWDQADDAHARADQEVEAARSELDKLIGRAKLPLEGLGFDAVDATYEGQRWSDIGTSRQLRLGLAIGAAQHPGLKVFVIHRGESLDKDSIAEVEAWCQEQKAQVLMEVVGGEGHEGAYVIEAGRIKEGD